VDFFYFFFIFGINTLSAGTIEVFLEDIAWGTQFTETNRFLDFIHVMSTSSALFKPGFSINHDCIVNPPNPNTCSQACLITRALFDKRTYFLTKYPLFCFSKTVMVIRAELYC